MVQLKLNDLISNLQLNNKEMNSLETQTMTFRQNET